MATQDILQKLKGGHDEFINLSDKLYYKTALQEMAVTPKWWEEYGNELNGIPFNWQKIKYTELRKELNGDPSLGNGTGVYLFVIEPSFKLVSLPGFVFYVGIAGENDSKRHLRVRLKEYIQYSNIKKRDKVITALELYHKETYVYFSKLNVTTKKLSEIESWLHGFYMPWANERDYPAKIKKARKSWGK